MNDSQAAFPVRFFAGLGLLIVGLLSGILIMLFLSNNQELGEDLPRVVEKVELRSSATGSNDSAYPTDSIDFNGLSTAKKLSESFQDVASTVTPAVVFIRVELAASTSERGWFPRFGGNPRQSVGSGVIIDETGYIVTNNHVVEGAEHIVVTLDDKRQYEAEVIGTDKSTDLAIIKASAASGLPSVTLGDSDELSVGEWVIAIGNPFRLTSTVTAGIVSALGRQVEIIDDVFGIEDFIQTDAAINPGNSGGALVDLKGNLIGINTAIATESGSYEGYGFAVPVNLVERVVQDLITFGEVKRGYLGVSIRPVDAASANELGLDRIAGVYIDNIFAGGSADKSGLQDGDVVLSINGRQVDEPNDLQVSVAIHRPGDQLEIEVWRDKSLQTFIVELFGRDDETYKSWVAEMDDQQSEAELRNRLLPSPDDFEEEIAQEAREWGVGLKELTDRTRTIFEVQHGAYIAFIFNGSPAHNGNVPRDVVLLDVNGEKVYSVDNALSALEKVKESDQIALFRVKRRDGQIAFYEADFSTKTD